VENRTRSEFGEIVIQVDIKKFTRIIMMKDRWTMGGVMLPAFVTVPDFFSVRNEPPTPRIIPSFEDLLWAVWRKVSVPSSNFFKYGPGIQVYNNGVQQQCSSFQHHTFLNTFSFYTCLR
jgi:hypothetical protein